MLIGSHIEARIAATAAFRCISANKLIMSGAAAMERQWNGGLISQGAGVDFSFTNRQLYGGEGGI